MFRRVKEARLFCIVVFGLPSSCCKGQDVKRLFFIGVCGLCVALFAAASARGEFQAGFVQVPITAAAINASPELADAQTWQLQVTADNDLLSMEIHVRISGAILFQHAFGSTDWPPDPQLQAVFPSLTFHSYLDMPGDKVNRLFYPKGQDLRSYFNGPFDFTPSSVDSWLFNSSNDPPPIDYVAAQLTLVPTEGLVQHEWLVRFYERTPAMDVVEHIVVSPGLTSPFGGDINYDFMVNDADLGIWSTNFGQRAEPPFEFSPANRFVDFDSDGDTDHFDGGILLMNLGASPATPEQGDVDGGGAINGDDLKILFDYEWGHKWNSGDVNQDLQVDGADFLQWQRQFGSGFSSVVATGAAIPEPASRTLALMVFSLLAARRWPHCSGLSMP